MQRTNLLACVLTSVLAVAAVVIAVTIYSATVQRTQDVYGQQLGLVVDPDPFPDIVIDDNGNATQVFTANVTNPASNPELVVIVTVSLTTTCGSGNVSISGTSLCLGDWNTSAQAIAPGDWYEWSIQIDYSNSFIGQAAYDIQAEGTP